MLDSRSLMYVVGRIGQVPSDFDDSFGLLIVVIDECVLECWWNGYISHRLLPGGMGVRTGE